MRFIFALGLAGPEDSTVPNESHAIAGMFAAIFEYELGDVGFARSPRFSAIMRSYCSFVVRASGKSRLRLRASSSAIPLSLRGVRGGEKATVLAVLHVFAARFRARANSHRFGKKLLAISLGQDRERRRARDLREPGCVDVHHHVNRRFHFG